MSGILDRLRPKTPTAGVGVGVYLSGVPLSGVAVHLSWPGGARTGTTNEAGYVAFWGLPVGVAVTSAVLGNDRYDGVARVDTFVAGDQNIRIGLTAVVRLPPVPSRAQVCQVKTSIQGLNYQSVDYPGQPIPAGFFWWLLSDRKTSVYQAHKAAGDTHVSLEWSGAYKEPGTLWPDRLREGSDFSQDLPALKAIALEAIMSGLFVDLPMAGDGESRQGGGYNDDVGKTYGYDWLLANMSRLLAAMRGDAGSACPDGIDLTPYIVFRTGWDGVFYGWEPPREKIRAIGERFRAILPAGYLGIEHGTGHIPAGEGDADWQPGGCMQAYDVLLTEFDAPLLHNGNVWQIAARTLGPRYRRPADQPVVGPDADLDGSTKWYLRAGTPRGEFFVIAFEFDTYHWCRGRITLAQVEADRAYLRSVGYQVVC